INFAIGSKRGYFDYISSRPYYQNAFDTVMASPYRRDAKSWLDFFPVEERLQVQSSSDFLVVDVGGGRGKDLQTFREKFSNLPGRLVLQDLPHVLETTDVPSYIEIQAHNFFDEQPIKRAKATYLRTVLHDWPDKQAMEILSRILEAMSPNSLLLIHVKAMPETNVPWMAAIGDMTMMTAFSSAERTKNEWESLLNKAGFKINAVWKPEGTSAQQQVLIEGALQSFE
ncbi:S-adenosyl-L-methionine-dependent methyltransferase, partial [Aspergillus campestris IBT 28561]